MLIRISLIVAIIAGLAAAGLNFLQVKDKITTTLKERDDFHAQADSELAAHKKFEKLAKDTQAKLDTTTKELADTKTERDTAVAAAEEANKKEVAATEALKKTEVERNKAQDELAAWKALSIPLDQIRATIASVKTLTEEK